MSHPKNHTRYKTLDRVAADPRILKVWDEGDDGVWASLVQGYNYEGCSALHGWTVHEVLDQHRDIDEGETY